MEDSSEEEEEEEADVPAIPVIQISAPVVEPAPHVPGTQKPGELLKEQLRESGMTFADRVLAQKAGRRFIFLGGY